MYAESESTVELSAATVARHLYSPESEFVGEWNVK